MIFFPQWEFFPSEKKTVATRHQEQNTEFLYLRETKAAKVENALSRQEQNMKKKLQIHGLVIAIRQGGDW